MGDAYRDWLRQNLGAEFGTLDAERLIQNAVVRREWGVGRPLGPREAVAVLQDAYIILLDRHGDTQAEHWLQHATVDLARLAERVPAPSFTLTNGHVARPLTPPPTWGRRASDLALILARPQ